MQPVDRVARETFEQAVRQHGEGAAAAFLGRLEDQVQRASEIGVFGEVAGGAEQHRGVAVMAAGVHLARDGGRIGRAGLLVDRQGIHVGTQPDGPLAGTAPGDGAHDTGPADALGYGDAPLTQLLRDQGGGTFLFQPEFGVGVDVASYGGEFGMMGFEPLAEAGLHGDLPIGEDAAMSASESGPITGPDCRYQRR